MHNSQLPRALWLTPCCRVCLASTCTALQALCDSEQLQLWRDVSVQLQSEAQLQQLLLWLEAKRAEVQSLTLSLAPQLSIICVEQNLGRLTALTSLTLSEHVYLPDPGIDWKKRCWISQGPAPLPPSLPSSVQELSACIMRPALPAGVAAATQLQSLSLFCGSFEMADLAGIQQLQHLTALKLDCTWGHEVRAEMTEDDNDLWLGVYNPDLEHAYLPQLSALTALRSLSVVHLRYIEDCDMWLPALQKLTALYLPFCAMPQFPKVLSTLTGWLCVYILRFV